MNSNLHIAVCNLALLTYLHLSCLAIAADPSPPPKVPNGQDQLGQRLIRKAIGHGDEDVMDTMIRLMGEAAGRLEVSFDAGPETQEIQRQIIEQLEGAIKQAAAQRRPVSKPRQTAQGEKRRMPKLQAERNQPKPSADPSEAAEGTGASDPSAVPQGQTEQPASITNSDYDIRQAWGHLPERARDEVIQGIREEFLETYREWIERYYRALQETND